MRTIQSHIEELGILKQYIFDKIDGKGEVIMINPDAIKEIELNPDLILEMYFSTSVILWNSSEQKAPSCRELTFEEYYQNHLNFS